MISSKCAVSVALLLPLLQIDVMTDDGEHQERQKEEVRKPLGTGISLRCRHFSKNCFRRMKEPICPELVMASILGK